VDSKVLVTKQLLDGPQVNAILKERGRECGAEAMRMGVKHFGFLGNYGELGQTAKRCGLADLIPWHLRAAVHHLQAIS
jgi:hypothetical protein